MTVFYIAILLCLVSEIFMIINLKKNGKKAYYLTTFKIKDSNLNDEDESKITKLMINIYIRILIYLILLIIINLILNNQDKYMLNNILFLVVIVIIEVIICQKRINDILKVKL